MLKYCVLAFLSIVVYLQGFFPISKSDVTTPAKDAAPNIHNIKPLQPPSTISKTVLIIIDGLRLDFVTPDLMPNVCNKFQTMGCFINLTVETPTVTMPRIKAMTTGKIPQFVDIILNLARVESLPDSLIHKAVEGRKKIVFYGDDTWLKLFPTQFKRSEGTSSFYVHDFKEVDDNVTRNVNWELEQDDWDIMILHYLGLDHIGHVLGPRSNLIAGKLQEMDQIYARIHEKLARKSEKSLIIVTGDHGMKDSGGHGGSTHPEVYIPFIVSGLHCLNDSFPQIDLTANIAMLLGLDIPLTSIGQIRPSLFKNLSFIDYLHVLRYNTFHLLKKNNLCEENFSAAINFHRSFLQHNKQIALGQNAKSLYEKCSRLISERLIKTTANQSSLSLIISIVITLTILSKLIQIFIFEIRESKHLEMAQLFIIWFILLFEIFEDDKYLSMIFIIISIVLLTVNLYNFKYAKISLKFNVMMMVVGLHPFTFLSTSFIEEEHQFWYFSLGTFIIYNLIEDFRRSESRTKFWSLLMLMGIRFLRTINQTGDQWASLPDLADWLLQKPNYIPYQILFVSSLILIFYYCIIQFPKSSKFNVFLTVAILLGIFLFRITGSQSVMLGQILWSLITLQLILNLITKSNIITSWILIITLLLKPYNTIFIPASIFASQYFKKRFNQSPLITILSHLFLMHFLFFAQGHCNSLSSIDISTGYIGMSHYQPFFVFCQVLIHTYALPILSFLLLLNYKSIDKGQAFITIFIHRLYVITVVFIITFVQRHHLFIWSVFAPKVIVEASHFFVSFIMLAFYYFYVFTNRFLYKL